MPEFYNFFIFFVTLVVLFIWLDTDAVVEYAMKFRIPLPLLYEYWDSKKQNNISYADFLDFNIGGFTTRLLACPYCLSVILNIIFYLTLCSRFHLVEMCINIVLSWICYPILKKITRG
jgi:hypothetical protein